jgi:hypothetical protein
MAVRPRQLDGVRWREPLFYLTAEGTPGAWTYGFKLATPEAC